MGCRRTFGAVAVLALVVLLLPWPAPAPGSAPPAARVATDLVHGLISVPTVTDNDQISVATTLGTIGVTDAVAPGTLLPAYRSYSITLRVTFRDDSAGVVVETDPVAQWAFPAQLPGGADNLPAFADWNWWVSSGTVNDTANWTLSPNGTELERSAPLRNATFTVGGVSRPSDVLALGTGVAPGASTPALGLVMANPAPPGPGNRTVPELLSVAQSLDPQVIRFGLSSVSAVSGWDNATGTPEFNFTGFDAELAFIADVPAAPLLSIPAGNWGDGNNLPPGMPTNTSFNVSFYGLTGQYPDPAAYATFVGAIVNHTIEAGENVAYWNIGNEVPVFPTQDAQAYAQTFNAAARAIHHRLPNALVGSDVLMVRAGFPTLSAQLRGVGFLSYHLYSSTSICIEAGGYCPPSANGPGINTPMLLTSGVGLSRRYFYAPHLAQEMWFNATGRWLPVLDTESNIDTVAGGVVATSSGTDPRMQNQVAAAWLLAMLMTGAEENLSELTYFNLQDAFPVNGTITAPLGGWGFGMTGITPARSVVYFAPYWAARLWSQAFPAGAPAHRLTVADPGIVQAFAARNGSGVSVVVANLVDVPVHLSVATGATNLTTQSAEYLDGSTYQQPYNASNGTAYLARSGIGERTFASGASSLLLGGYGVALFHLGPASTGGSGSNGSGNGSGGGNSSGNRSGSGQGNSSGTGGNGTSSHGGNDTNTSSTGGSNSSQTGGSGSTGGSSGGSSAATGGHGNRPPGGRTGPGGTSTSSDLPAWRGPGGVGGFATRWWQAGLLALTGAVIVLGVRAARRDPTRG